MVLSLTYTDEGSVDLEGTHFAQRCTCSPPSAMNIGQTFHEPGFKKKAIFYWPDLVCDIV